MTVPGAPSDEELDLYREMLGTVRTRLQMAGQFLDYDPPGAFTVEVAALQLRQVLESVTLASLITNEHLLKQVRTQLHKLDYDRARKTLQQAHPGYWPTSRRFVRAPGPVDDLLFFERTEGVVLKSDIGPWYGVTSDLLHTRNPLGKPLDAQEAWTQLSDLHDRLTRLLVNFSVTLMGRPHAVICQLDASEDGTHSPGTGEVVVSLGALSAAPPA